MSQMKPLLQLSHSDLELHQRREPSVECTRREAQLAALQYEEEKIRTKQIQRDAVLDFVRVSPLPLLTDNLDVKRSKCLFILPKLSVIIALIEGPVVSLIRNLN